MYEDNDTKNAAKKINKNKINVAKKIKIKFKKIFHKAFSVVRGNLKMNYAHFSTATAE